MANVVCAAFVQIDDKKKSALSEERRKSRMSFVARLWKLSWIVVVVGAVGA